MKPRRHLLGGLLLIGTAGVIAVADWSVFDGRVAVPVAALLALAGLANVALGLGRPEVVGRRQSSIEAFTYLVFALLGVTIVAENVLAPDGPISFVHAALWGLVALVTGWLGAAELRSGETGERHNA